MAYIKNTWVSNDLISAEKLNHIEEGIIIASARAWTIDIATSDWTSSSGSFVYSAALENIDVATYIAADIKNGSSYVMADIDWETKNGELVFTTATKPTGTITLLVAAWGTESGSSNVNDRTKWDIAIPVASWSGSGPYIYSYTATGMTADTTIAYKMDETVDYLSADITIAPSAGKLTFSTGKKPTGTVNILVFEV